MPQDKDIEALTGILWSVHGEYLRSIFTGIQRRVISQAADTIGTDLANALAPMLMTQYTSFTHVPRINVEYYWCCGPYVLAVITEPPQCRTLRFSPDFTNAHSNRRPDNKAVGQFHLALPYTVFVFVQDADLNRELYVFFRTSPWANLDDELLTANLPNIYPHGGTCLHHYESESDEPLDAATDLIDYFWQGLRTNELTKNFGAIGAAEPDLAKLDVWEMFSLREPRFILSAYPNVVNDSRVETILENLEEEARKNTCALIMNCCAELLAQQDNNQLVQDALVALNGALRYKPPSQPEVDAVIRSILERRSRA